MRSTDLFACIFAYLRNDCFQGEGTSNERENNTPDLTRTVFFFLHEYFLAFFSFFSLHEDFLPVLFFLFFSRCFLSFLSFNLYLNID